MLKILRPNLENFKGLKNKKHKLTKLIYQKRWLLKKLRDGELHPGLPRDKRKF